MMTGAVWAARLRANAVVSGRPPDLIDMHRRDSHHAHPECRDFEGLGVRSSTPWTTVTAITETVVEEATLEWLASLGWHRFRAQRRCL